MRSPSPTSKAVLGPPPLSGSHRQARPVPLPGTPDPTPVSPRVWLQPNLRQSHDPTKPQPRPRSVDPSRELSAPRSITSNLPPPLLLRYDTRQIGHTLDAQFPHLKDLNAAVQECAQTWTELLVSSTADSPERLDKAIAVARQLEDALSALLLQTGAQPELSAQHQRLQLLLQAHQTDLQTLGRLTKTASIPLGERPLGLLQELLSARYDNRSGAGATIQQARAFIQIDASWSADDVDRLMAPPGVPGRWLVEGLQEHLDSITIRALFDAGIPINARTAPDPVLTAALAKADRASPRHPRPRTLGQGQVNTITKVKVDTGSGRVTYAWRPENPEADAIVMVDCGIPRRHPGQRDQPAPRLTCRQVLTGRLALHLGLDRHIKVTQAWPVVHRGCYGSLNEYLPDLQGYLLHQVVLPVPERLQEQLKSMGKQARSDLLAEVASQHGLFQISQTRTGWVAEAAIVQDLPGPRGPRYHQRYLVLAIDTADPAVRRQFTAAAWLQLLTGEADHHMGNIGFVPQHAPDGSLQMQLALYDNDMSFGCLLLDPQDTCQPRRDRSEGQAAIRPPRSVMSGRRYPQVIPADLAQALLTIDFEANPYGIDGLLDIAEHKALVSRLTAIQAEIRRLQKRQPPALLQTDTDWTSPTTTTRLGLDDVAGQAQQMAADQAGTASATANHAYSREVESFGLLRYLAVTQEVARQDPQQTWFPVLVDQKGVVRDIEKKVCPPTWSVVPVPSGPSRRSEPYEVQSPRKSAPRRERRPLPVAMRSWEQEQGLQPAETQALVDAGLEPPQVLPMLLPGPEIRAIQRTRSRPAPTGVTPPTGWLALSFDEAGIGLRHYWFQPINTHLQLERLQLGLFLRQLASALGMEAQVPEVRPFFHHDGTQTIYGMLIEAQPGAASAVAGWMDKPTAHELRQCVALDWMAYLIEVPINHDQLLWTRDTQGRHLTTRLPADAPASYQLTTTEAPPRPLLIDTDWARKLLALSARRINAMADRCLTPSMVTQLLDRITAVQNEVSRGVAQQIPSSDWMTASVSHDLGLDEARKRGRQVVSGKQAVDKARTLTRADGLAARLTLEHSILSRQSSPGSSPLASPLSSPRGSKRVKHALQRTLKSDRVQTLTDPDQQARHGVLQSRWASYRLLRDQPLTWGFDRTSASREPLGTGNVFKELRHIQSQLIPELQALGAQKPLPDDLQDILTELQTDAKRLAAGEHLLQQLETHGVPEPLEPTSATGLMTLCALEGLSTDAIIRDIRTGASTQDLISAHALKLQPGWIQLAQGVIDQQAQALALQSGTENQSEIRQRLRQTHPLPTTAQAVRQIIHTPQRPKSGRRSRHASPYLHPMPTRPQRTAIDQHLALRTSVLWVASTRLKPVRDAAMAYEKQRLLLAQLKLSSLTDHHADLIATRKAVDALTQELASIIPFLEGDEQEPGRQVLSTMKRQLAQESAAIDSLRLHEQTLSRLLPPETLDTIAVGELLPLLEDGGPDIGFLLHGLLIGWNCADILRAHLARWPAWGMECGATFAEAITAFERASPKVASSIQQMRPVL